MRGCEMGGSPEETEIVNTVISRKAGTLREAGASIFDEMSIVDVLTKLIFDAEVELHGTELLVVELLGQVDTSLAASSRRDVGEYLRAMGVDEMIAVVNRIKRLLDCQQGVIAASGCDGGSSLSH